MQLFRSGDVYKITEGIGYPFGGGEASHGVVFEYDELRGLLKEKGDVLSKRFLDILETIDRYVQNMYSVSDLEVSISHIGVFADASEGCDRMYEDTEGYGIRCSPVLYEMLFVIKGEGLAWQITHETLHDIASIVSFAQSILSYILPNPSNFIEGIHGRLGIVVFTVDVDPGIIPGWIIDLMFSHEKEETNKDKESENTENSSDI